LRAIALALTVLTGFTGLVYEVTWQKCLAILLGSHSEATAAVLGIFLGGLSVGYGIFGRVTRWRVERAEARGDAPRLLLLYGLVEGAIGLHALAFPWLFQTARAASLGLPQLPDGIAFGIDVGLTALLIGPPTVLMGGTIPVLTQALARSVADATRVHAHIYAFNTVGAFAGALSAGFFLVPWLGIGGVLLAMGFVNLGAGTVFAVLGRRRTPVETALAAPPAPRRAPEGFALYAGAALLLGFAMMATQTVLIRLGGLSLGASHFTFAMVVAVFVLCIALGSFAVSAAPRIPRAALPATVWALTLLLGALYLELENAPYYAHVLRTYFGTEAEDFYPYHLTTFGALLAVLLVPVGLSGASLPLLFHHLRNRIGDLGGTAGRLYSWNTVGNLLGALLGGHLLLLWLDLHHVYRLGTAATAVAAALLTGRVLGGGHLRVGAAVAVAGAVLALLPAWEPDRLSSGLFRVREAQPLTGTGADFAFTKHGLHLPIDFYTDDPAVSVAVKRHPARDGQGMARAIFTNGKPDGSTASDYPTMALAGLVPCLMAEACERSFVIGFGTGITAGELAELDSMREVVVAEISRGVVEAAPLFDFANHRASRHPRIHIRRSDAYRALLRSRGGFDVIASEPSNPWVTGVEMLYSQEFLEAARGRLRPGGIYAQWFHLYENDASTVELVLRTYRSVFDRVAVWYTAGPDILLLGFAEATSEPRLDRLLERFERPDFRAGLRRAGIWSLPELLVHELWPRGALGALELEGPIHTLLHPRLSHAAARAFFRGQRARLPSIASVADEVQSRSLVAGLRTPQLEASDEDERRAAMVGELCTSPGLRCTTGLAWWGAASPDSVARRTLLGRLRRQGDGGLLAPERLRHLELLFGGSPIDGRHFSYDEATRLTELFETHYLVSLPFDRRQLARVWERCRDAEDRCGEGRRAAAARLGGLPEPEEVLAAERADRR